MPVATVLFHERDEARMRGGRRPNPLFLTKPALERDVQRREEVRQKVLGLLTDGAMRQPDIEHRLPGHNVHNVLRGLRDEGRIHADLGYWVLGPRKNRRW